MTGDSYEGDWINDKMSGFGKFVFNNEKKVYEG